MVSIIRPFLIEKAKNDALTDDFYANVGISSQRVESIIFGRCGATITEINNVAKYFNIPTSNLLRRSTKYPIITMQCDHCSGDFIPSNARAIYCSDACRNKAFRASK